MANSRNGGFNDGREDQANNQDFEDSSSSLSGVEAAASGVGSGGGGGGSLGVSGSGVELTERLTNILVDEGDGDLLLQVNDREDRVMQWIQALDMQVIGACRADERLKPMLKHNASSGAVEDNLLAHLSQHFEPSEVGLLARCFCIPLVSIRVGKVHQRGAQLCPSDRRGNLNLTLLPTSDLRLSFIGDDGYSERLFTLHNKSQCSIVAVEEILADSTGRSFLVKTPEGKVMYFWFSEKSKLLGIELLTKMKDLLKRKPSIAELTGISEARLGCFASNLRAYLVGSTASNRHTSSGEPGSITAESAHEPSVTNQNVQSNASTKCESIPRNLCSVLNVAREQITEVDNLIIASPVITDAASSNLTENEKPQEDAKFSPTSFLESLGKFAAPPPPLGIHVSDISSPLFSPYYCWCPPGPSSTLQYSAALPHLPTSLIESTSLPPLSSLLPPTRSTFLSTPPLSLPQMDFPALFPDPMARFPMPNSQHIPTFVMCDPIVHVPVIDVCSSGQGYLVSAGPAIPTTISPLHLNPMIREADSVMEKGARETLRMLLSASSQTTIPQAQMMGVFPIPGGVDAKQSMVVTGSRGLYSGTRDVGAIAAMGLVPLSLGRCESSDNMPQESSSGSDKKGSEENMEP